ncbi:protease inhibitor I42 family protein [Plantactinospora sp. WMMB782]|uniref:protease inhibitor I42 family protein n=1 Tax=Plantactinospora sp. WMMB782 TaxID=3404121 RepID=UPI003B93EAB1
MSSPKRLGFVLVGAALALVLVVGLATVVGLRIRRDARYGTVLDRQATSATVESGERFSIRVPDRGASVGDNWTATAEPADAVALVEDELISGSLTDRIFGPSDGGGGGNRYFLFDARRSGQVTITLANCFQGCGSERTRAASETVTWTVTVS